MLEKKVISFFFLTLGVNLLIKQAISKEQGQALADEYHVKFLETSAKSNIGSLLF